MTYSTKKKLQSLFKKLGYWLFKLVYGEIKDYKPINNYSDTQIKKSQIKSNLEYNVYSVNSARIYTDTINDSAIIKDNFVDIGINLPTDDMIRVILTKNFSDKQIQISEKNIEYVLKNIERSYEKINLFSHSIDGLSLTKAQPINLQLIKKVLNELSLQ